MGSHSPQMGTLITKTIDTLLNSSKIRPNMARDYASILTDAMSKAKCKPSSATSVVGVWAVLVKQEKDKELL